VPSKKEIDAMVLEYNCWYKEHGDDFRSVGWNKPKHEMRFAALLRNWPELVQIKKYGKPKFEILDLGCGLAHLNEYLIKNRFEVDYTGVDINEKFIELNTTKFPFQKFLLSNANELFQSADFIFASGLFNRRFSDSETFFRQTVKNIINKSRVGCSFNCLSTTATSKNLHNYYVSMKQIEQLLDRNIVEYFNIDGQSVPGEITVHIKKISGT